MAADKLLEYFLKVLCTVSVVAVCRVTSDSTSTCFTGDVRLVGGSVPSEGRVEICYNQVWGTICDRGWDRQDAAVVCQQLGFPSLGAVAWWDAHFGRGIGQIWLDNIRCTGSESSLSNCKHNGIGVHAYYCGHDDDAGVECPAVSVNASCLDGDVRLMGGASKLEGRVEVCYNNHWGTVCHYSWSNTNALVVCRQLGYYPFGATTSYFGGGTGGIYLNYVKCNGDESRLIDCGHSGIGVHRCDHTDDAGVKCKDVTVTNCTHGEVRLVNGLTIYEGRVEVCVYGVWGTVCHHRWSPSDAIVVCRQLGYPTTGIRIFRHAYFGLGTGPVHISLVYCSSNEQELLNCSFLGFDNTGCSHSYDAGVRCTNSASTCTTGDIRLVGGSVPSEGRVEICYNQEWGTICGSSWDRQEAAVVCQQLGLPSLGAVSWSKAHFGRGIGQIWLDNLHCTGSEVSLLTCTHDGVGVQSSHCGHDDDAGVECPPAASANCSNWDVRLVDGSSELEGRVEMCYNQRWGTVCHHSWNDIDADVVCQQLGLSSHGGSIAYGSSRFRGGKGSIYLDNVQCSSSALRLIDCGYSGIGVHDCHHTDDAGVECNQKNNCTNGDIQLRGGSSEREGRVEICIHQTWGTICDSSWDSREADVVCKQLGYPSLGTIARANAYFGRGKGPIWIDDLRCTGSESSLLNCTHDGIGVRASHCGHDDDVGVECPAVSVNTSCLDGDIHLVGRASKLEGRVEICYNNQWGTVCDDIWRNTEANVVCRQLGYYPLGATAYSNSKLGRGTRGIYLSQVNCDSSESRLIDCRHRGIGVHKCNHADDAGVRCKYVMITNCTHGEVRLVNGLTIYEGRVEICVYGVWGTVCHNGWSLGDATVVCRQLGYPTTNISAFKYAYFGLGTGPVHISHVGCVGTEQELLNCPFSGFDNTYCRHSFDAGVRCTTSTSMCTDGDVQLVGGSVPSEGRVEICYNQVWGTICDRHWGRQEAIVVCQQLGFSSLGAVYLAQSNAHFGRGIGQIWLDNLHCTGREVSLLTCSHDGIGVNKNYCSHYDDAGVKCSLAVSANCSNGDVRLVDGSYELEGRVEVCYNQSWGTVCHHSWDNTDADVVCSQLGLSPYGSIAYRSSHFQGGKGGIYLDNVRCTSSASRLIDCGHSGIGVHSQQCDHTNDAGVKCRFLIERDNCTNGEVRLRGGASEREGRVEICIRQTWGTICDSSWDSREADIVCKQLGYPSLGAIVRVNAYFGRGKGPIWLDDLRCTGSESKLLYCPHDGIGVYASYCGHDDDVGVECPAISENTTCLDGDIRLVGGASELEGRVEVCYNNQWGTVCDDSWSNADASVACKQLGYYPFGTRIYSASYFRGGTGRIYLDDVNCNGRESRLIDCSHSGIGVHNCDHTDDAGVRCLNVTNCTHGEVRLVNGLTIYEGRVEVCVYGVWGTVCHHSWSPSDAIVVCRQLGYPTTDARFFGSAYFGPGTGPVHISYVQCSGTEQEILKCSFSGFDNTHCIHGFDAGVRCINSTSTCTTGDIRLVGGSVPSEGRVEICYNHVWGTICDTSWDRRDAAVVCQQLGFPSLGAVAWWDAHFGRGIGQIWLDNIRCTGRESSLSNCKHNGIGVYASYCWHDDDAGVECPAGVSTNCSNGDVRLVDGPTELEGRVEVCYDQSWGTVCHHSWVNTNADVVCKQLGLSPYGGSVAYSTSHFGGGKGGIYLDNVYCTRSASRLIDCGHNGVGVHNCDHTNDASVKCQQVFVSFTASDYEVDEGNGIVLVCLMKTGQTTQSFMVDIIASESSPVEAEDSLDFRSAIKTVTFAGGGEECVEFDIINDSSALEDQERFSVSFQLPTGVQLGAISKATVTIIDSDDICPADTTTLITTNTTYSWPATKRGVTEFQPCPSQSGSSPCVTRYCGGSDSSGAVWSEVDYSQCSAWVISVLHTESFQSEKLTPEIVSELIELTDIVLTDKAITNPEVAELYLDIIDTIQQVNASAIKKSEEQSDTSLSSRVMESLGRLQNEIELSLTNINGSQVFTRERFALNIGDIVIESFSGESFNVDLGSYEEALSLNVSIPEEAIQTTVDTLANVTASITVPPNLITDLYEGANHSMKSQRLSYSVFLTDILFQSPNQTAQNLSIGTVIIGLRLRTNKSISLLVNNTFYFSEIMKARSSHCVHWEASDKFGEWSSDDCRKVESEGEEKICECSIDHPSAHFAVLFDLNPSPPPPGVGTALEVITYVGLTVSVLSLIIMIATYLATKNLRNSHHGQILLNICISLLGLYIFFLVAAHVTGVPGLCGFVSALLHYFILVFFGWTAAEAVYICIKLVKVLGIDKYERGFTWKAAIIIWSTPALIAIISMAGYKYYTSKYYCRPTQWPFFFGLVLPIVVIIVFNWVMFFVVIVSIFKHTQASVAAGNKGKIQRIKQKVITAMVLAVMFGLGWGLGFLATSTAVQGITITFQIIFALFVGSQGLLLLIFHGLRNEKARESWKQCFKTVSGIYTRAFSSFTTASTSNTGKMSTAASAPSYSMATLEKSNPLESVSVSSPSCAEAAADIEIVESEQSTDGSIVGAINQGDGVTEEDHSSMESAADSRTREVCHGTIAEEIATGEQDDKVKEINQLTHINKLGEDSNKYMSEEQTDLEKNEALMTNSATEEV